MPDSRKQRKGGFEPLLQAFAVVLALCIAPSCLEAQKWSEPFQHNEEHLGYGDYTHPYSPWNSLTMSVPPANVVVAAGTPVASASFIDANYPWPPGGNGAPTFNAVHMSVIPKGPHQGKVLVWNDVPVIGLTQPIGAPALGPNLHQAYQAYAIVDPADTPAAWPLQPGSRPRFFNYLLPIGQFPSLTGPPPLPPNGPILAQNIFCAGHAWTNYGDLAVVGGTDYWYNGGVLYHGGVLTFVWGPTLTPQWPGATPAVILYPGHSGGWVQGPDLEHRRWYPTATLTHDLSRVSTEPAAPVVAAPRIVVGGGVETVPPLAGDVAVRTYEALVVAAAATQANSGLVRDKADTTTGLPYGATGYVWQCPNLVAGTLEVDWLGEYPRQFLISDGRLFFAGYATRGAWLDHDANPGVWIQAAAQPGGTYSSNWQHARHDGSAVLFPNLGGAGDRILRIGGARHFGGETTETVESLHAGQNGTWVSEHPMPVADEAPNGSRSFANAVILPTAAILVLGGLCEADADGRGPLYSPLLFEDGRWYVLPPNAVTSRRTYHSVAVLLPDGRVLLAGGDDRDFDYEIFSPAYLNEPANRPVNGTWLAPAPFFDPTDLVFDLQRNTTCTVEFDPLPLGQTITKAVLMAPCSVTHHSDMHQRYVELRTDVTNGNRAEFATDVTDKVVPRGIYLLFFVSNTSVSEAKWVRFQ